ncbi:PadR family transcriptional regulator [Georgenia yuyongxinii]|uniref:PadR family transcriptional regulator n=1 Tax=Georgenia yuyongxinii TaxID=2589797 RepID=A0A5B8C9I0_9MICO|nr:PadR family transcriptional regulator [Georgenia yuyongxinii]QDC25832.1 PadR family transcriptional regulator [Georgenia yuyongxinii]
MALAVSPARDPQLLKGVLPMLVLALLKDRDSYGYELVTRLQHAGLVDIAAGSVYPVLARLERDELVGSYLVPSSAGPARKYYTPVPAGLSHLATQRRAWRALGDVVDAVFAAAHQEEP